MTEAEAEYGCAVPGCDQPALCGWGDERSGKGLRTCQKHLHKHYDKGDPFDFYLLLKIHRPLLTRKDKNTMAKKQKKAKKANGIGVRIAAMFTKKGVKMATREIEAALNKGKKTDQQTSIHAIRAATKTLIADKQLVIVEVVSKQFVLAKYGTPRTKSAKVAKSKPKKKKAKRKIARATGKKR